ncbi:MAG: hypothetical protein K1W21_12215, partial [Oscillospiraceae bacterium]
NNLMVQFYEAECLTTVPHEPPPDLTGPCERCAGCPYPGHGFVCWNQDGATCIRTEVARIMERQKCVASAG